MQYRKKWPIIFFFPDDSISRLRSPVIQKQFQTKSATTSAVACTTFFHKYNMKNAVQIAPEKIKTVYLTKTSHGNAPGNVPGNAPGNVRVQLFKCRFVG